ncbi:MAG TPA: cobalamin-binding protein [Syntrophomonadaceae bacterium]|nr:cobalamin-binding protein [Syntrophomonadaceae bacterium]
MVDFEEIKKSVFAGQVEKTRNLAASLVQSGTDPLSVINDGLIAGMNEVGIKFKAGEMFVPEVIMSAKAMSAGVEAVKPFIKGDEIQTPGVIVIGTVKGDLHDIGKNLVCMILESAGFKVIDIGVDNSPEQFIEAVKEHQPQIVGMSALLTTTMPAMKETIDAFVEAGIRDTVKIIVGGAPVSRQFAEEIGADGYGEDAIAARDLCIKLVS